MDFAHIHSHITPRPYLSKSLGWSAGQPSQQEGDTVEPITVRTRLGPSAI